MKRIDEIMDHYKVEDGFPVEIAALDQGEKERILQKTMNKLGIGETGLNEQGVTEEAEDRLSVQESRRSGFRRRRVFTVSVAAAVIFSMVCVSAAYFGLNSDFIKFLNPADDHQAAVLGEVGCVVDESASDRGTTLHVKEMVGDTNSVYILFDLIGPEGTVLDKDGYHFEEMDWEVNPHSAGGFWIEDIEREGAADNILSFVLVGNRSGNLRDTDMSLAVSNLMYYDYETEGYLVELPGYWEVEFKAKYKDRSQTYRPYKEVEYNGGQVLLQKVTISPLSVTAEFTGRSIGDDNSTSSSMDFVESDEIPIKVYMKDGTKFTGMRGSGTTTDGPWMEINVQYNKVLDIEEVDYLEILGIRIDVK